MRMTEHLPLDQLSRLSRDLSSEPDEASTVARAVQLGALLIDCALVDMLRLQTFGRAVLVASTDAATSSKLIEAMDEFGENAAENPALLCCPVSCSGGSAAETPVGNRYVLRFLSVDAVVWNEPEIRLAMAFADLAALAIDRSALRSRVQNLALGLESNRLIGTAVGILMAHRRATYDQAFDWLRICSQETNRKLRDIAEDVVLTGELPAPKARGAA
jgi:ANTAR domain